MKWKKAKSILRVWDDIHEKGMSLEKQGAMTADRCTRLFGHDVDYGDVFEALGMRHERENAAAEERADQGTTAYFESVAVVQSPASAVRKWTRYDVLYTMPLGPGRKASTFHGSIGRQLAQLEQGEKISIVTEKRGEYLNIVKLDVIGKEPS